MNVSLEEKKKEAIERMKYLQLIPEVANHFKEGTILTSEYRGVLWQTDPKIKKKIQAFEKQYDALVYHVIKGTYEIQDEKMTMDSFLYVSDNKDEWELDRNDMKNGCLLSYVYNETIPMYSEIGYIGVCPANGGLSRNDRGYDFEKENIYNEIINAMNIENENDEILKEY